MRRRRGIQTAQLERSHVDRNRTGPFPVRPPMSSSSQRPRPAAPPGHPHRTIAWVAGRGSGPEPRNDSDLGGRAGEWAGFGQTENVLMARERRPGYRLLRRNLTIASGGGVARLDVFEAAPLQGAYGPDDAAPFLGSALLAGRRQFREGLGDVLLGPVDDPVQFRRSRPI